MATANERERRATAGKRMSSLVGQALDDDEAFWNHDTWVEEDSGNDSFRESDEDSEHRVDKFDSDFDDSESDNDREEEAAGAEEELQLQRDERQTNRKHKFDIAKAGRDLMHKKKGKGKKRAMGDGFNAGLVLNLPSASQHHQPILPVATGVTAPPVPTSPLEQPTVLSVPQPLLVPATTLRASSRRSSRSLTHTEARRTLRAATHNKTLQAETKRKATTNSTVISKKKQKRFTQEELLLEAATVTEPENERWLLGRKRIQELSNESQKEQKDVRGKVICKFHSRRGCLNSLTFPDMDYLPDIFARRQSSSTKKVTSKPALCVITGKPAKYRDPKTMLGYHDLAAYRELRRRYDAGEPLDQRTEREKVDDVVDVPSLEAEHMDIVKSGEKETILEEQTSNIKTLDRTLQPYDLPRITLDAMSKKSVPSNVTKADPKQVQSKDTLPLIYKGPVSKILPGSIVRNPLTMKQAPLPPTVTASKANDGIKSKGTPVKPVAAPILSTAIANIETPDTTKASTTTTTGVTAAATRLNLGEASKVSPRLESTTILPSKLPKVTPLVMDKDGIVPAKELSDIRIHGDTQSASIHRAETAVTTTQPTTACEKRNSSVSPTTTNMISSALAMYAKLHDHQE